MKHIQVTTNCTLYSIWCVPSVTTGNKVLSEVTLNAAHEVRFEVTDWDDVTGWAEYSSFSVEGAPQRYKLAISGYNNSSTLGKSLSLSV